VQETRNGNLIEIFAPQGRLEMDKHRSIKKVYKKVKLHEQGTDYVYWQTQSPEKRLLTLEQIRQEYHWWKYDTQPGFQRVFSVTKR
jgi:hypothetical protein